MKEKRTLIRIITGAVIFAVGMLVPVSGIWRLVIFLASYLITGGDVVWKAVVNILHGQVFDENFLMSLATIGAFIVGEYPEGVAVMLFYQVGELFQSYAVNKSRASIADLMDIRPDYANLKQGGEIKRVSPDEVQVGDIIVVRPGEKVPLDGKVLSGSSLVDTSALTGESVPREVHEGSEILSGFINQNGLLTIEVEKMFGESTVSRILNLVENASSKKAHAEKFITKFARYYTPVVVLVALALAVLPPLILSEAFSDWIYRALIFLVVSCPCALVISIPLSFFGGIGGASRCGVLVKGSNYLEALSKAEVVVFDKTGTLTKGTFSVTEVRPKDVSAEELLRFAALAEQHSSHPISVSIRKAYGQKLDELPISGVEEISGHGVKAVVDGRQVFAGNARLMELENIAYDRTEQTGTVVHLALDGRYAGYILISDEVKEDAEKAIRELRKSGVKKTVMLTGDNRTVGEAVAEKLGIDEAYTQLLPDGKVERVEKLLLEKSPKSSLVFVGDGINDAPVLARADVGIAMGALGSDAAIEAADVVIMTDEPSKIASVMKVSRKALRIVKQNIVFALAVKAAILVLAAFGFATMWEGVFADVGVSVLAILNALRAMRVKQYQ
ncbi:heavy metal translocating P-type ATPase [Candidatus Soleaferrea massiliensis]|uniref:heavy metal translocating P-type ATPase n=1 Tax=Candidatus Soleaferrea massiliensis TaxID=1470354 RepID=UPI00058F48B9|nr:heavy metal translocating P-type ATPase [Candidatus Soleaferrea massiliensis]